MWLQSALMDLCIVATLGTGRDQLVPMVYNYLKVVISSNLFYLSECLSVVCV